MTDKFVVFATVGEMEAAEKIAGVLVEERLAACVNIVSNVRSVYRWEGKVANDAELLLIIKTEAGRFDEMKRRILALHPYDLPEVIALKIEEGHGPYLDWIASETKPDPSP